MEYLSPSQWNALNRVTQEIHELEDFASFGSYILNEIPSFLNGHFASWNEHNAQLFLERVRSSDSHHERVVAATPVLNKTLHSHPVFDRFIDFQTGQVRYVDTVERMREHIDDDSYYRTPFYQELAKEFDIEDQLLMHVAIENGRGVVLTFHSDKIIPPETHLQASILRGHILARLHALERKSVFSGSRNSEAIKTLRNSITPREFEVFQWLCTGKSSDEIARSLNIAKRTIDKHLENIFRKLGEENRTRAIARYAHLVRNTLPLGK